VNEVDPIQQWIDQHLEHAPAPTPEQASLIRRVFKTRPKTTDTSSPVPEAA
jgi:hypothetical protein